MTEKKGKRKTILGQPGRQPGWSIKKRLSRKKLRNSQGVCGENEIRTRDTLLAYTRFPGVPLQPLEHLSMGCRLLLEAERQGFEPRVPRGTTVFKTAAIDHSATSPELSRNAFLWKSVAKVMLFSESANLSNTFFIYVRRK